MDYAKYGNRKGVHMRVVPYRFGAYAMRAVPLTGFTLRDYSLLLAGEEVEVMTQLPS